MKTVIIERQNMINGVKYIEMFFLLMTMFAMSVATISAFFMILQVRKHTRIMVEFSIRRGWTEAIEKGYIKQGATELTEEAKKLIKPVEKDIYQFVKTKGKNLDPINLWLQLEQEFGNKILTQVCVPGRLSQGGCLVIAIQAAKIDLGLNLGLTNSTGQAVL